MANDLTAAFVLHNDDQALLNSCKVEWDKCEDVEGLVQARRGMILEIIRTRKLHRLETNPETGKPWTYERYVEENFGIVKSRAYQLISHYESFLQLDLIDGTKSPEEIQPEPGVEYPRESETRKAKVEEELPDGTPVEEPEEAPAAEEEVEGKVEKAEVKPKDWKWYRDKAVATIESFDRAMGDLMEHKRRPKQNEEILNLTLQVKDILKRWGSK